MNFPHWLPTSRARRSRRAAAASEAKLPRFEAHEGVSAATIAASSQCDSEFFVVGSGSGGDHGSGLGGAGEYGDFARPFGQPHTIADGYVTGSRARLMSL